MCLAWYSKWWEEKRHKNKHDQKKIKAEEFFGVGHFVARAIEIDAEKCGDIGKYYAWETNEIEDVLAAQACENPIGGDAAY